ncbi:alcohol oxidase [Leucogyrophana mollusca]|uniref:Alcohol oxidase n=1 Tax=Leucogyrophana mollusca TaxID=85980 RepID=A0ACB8BIT0_9AGAM|nr:alcohol oxidase [Leucogyrophana mollusca]
MSLIDANPFGNNHKNGRFAHRALHPLLPASMTENNTAKIQDVANKTFDIVIIGGGTAGLCLAARLTEDPRLSVLVLEAGNANFNDPALLLPAQYGHHFGEDAYDWQFKTTPQEFCGGKEFSWSRGKGLGGSSSINFLCWTKPPRSDVDDLERLGNPGWNWERFQRALYKLEGFQPPTPKSFAAHGLNFDDWTIGKDGPMKLSHPATVSRPELNGFQTWINMGIPRAPAPVGGNPRGAFFAPKTLDPLTYTRNYAANVFYMANAQRENLHVLTAAHGSKIVTRSEDGELHATGVEFLHEGKVQVVHAGKEVILCAGALKSPQILELSGIGRRHVLESLNVPVKLDLPGVGENVQEHMFCGITYELADSVEDFTLDVLRNPEMRAEHVKLLASLEGAFTMGISAFAFVPLETISDRAEDIIKAARERVEKCRPSYPPGLSDLYDMQLERLKNKAASCEIILFPGFLTFPHPPEPGKKYFTVLFALNHTFSRGTIHAVSTDPVMQPACDPHYFEEDIDLQTFIELAKFSRRMAHIAPFSEILAQPVKEVNPGPEVATDAQIGEHLKRYCGTTYHTVGSLSMLPLDKGGVVDNNLKVYGTSNIRVVDLSVVPLHIATHPMTMAYAIAEQAADIIRGQLFTDHA